MSVSWNDIWERKGRDALARDSVALAELLHADGFDSPTGSISLDDWLARGRRIRLALGLEKPQKRASVLEVGCGAGAMLATFPHEDFALSGVDASAPHVAIARQVLPAARIEVAPADHLPFADAGFDAVFSHSVFFYFPSLDYAECALREIVRVGTPRAPVLILDVPDAARRAECESAREALLGETAPPQGGPTHLYFPREWFIRMAHALGRRVSFTDEIIASHPMSAYRYHVLLQ